MADGIAGKDCICDTSGINGLYGTDDLGGIEAQGYGIAWRHMACHGMALHGMIGFSKPTIELANPS